MASFLLFACLLACWLSERTYVHRCFISSSPGVLLDSLSVSLSGRTAEWRRRQVQRSIHKASCRSIKCWMRSWLSRQYVDCSGSAAVETLKPSCVCSGWLRAGALRQEPRGRTARVQGLYAGESTRRYRASIHPSSRRFEQAHMCVMAMARSYMHSTESNETRVVQNASGCMP